ncbi:hypothetical protein SKAU_G00017820 [Synaphobranchus kaupii]|uniref:Uncharacterized protein n=1 Tax=Synaphobranchus kaupii TaxID=118154 RepID=A0A9Q1GBB4_SYNKA|nr:hypothetical protein SKAU_G00017820 [Synaphobranchus kaupii]
MPHSTVKTGTQNKIARSPRLITERPRICIRITRRTSRGRAPVPESRLGGSPRRPQFVSERRRGSPATAARAEAPPRCGENRGGVPGVYPRDHRRLAAYLVPRLGLGRGKPPR